MMKSKRIANKCFKTNENGNKKNQNLSDTGKAVLRGKFIQARNKFSEFLSWLSG